MEDQVPASAEVVQADTTASEATQNTTTEPAAEVSEEQRREQVAKAKENAAFAELRRQNREAREEAARERAERQALTQRLMQGQAAAPADSGDAAPDPAKYAGGEFNPDYVKDLTRYEARKLFQEHTATLTKRQQEQQAQQAREQAVRNWQASHQAASKKFPDFEVIVEAASADIPQQAKVLMAGLKDGAELLYFASKDPEKAKALNGSPVEVAAALGELRAEARYAAKIAAEKAAADATNERPITPGNGAGRSGSGEPDPRNIDAWMKWRAKN